MILNSKAQQPANTGTCTSGASAFYNGLIRIKTVNEFRMALELPVYHQPALNYPVYRLMHRLTDNSLMAVMAPKKGGTPVFIAAVDAKAEKLDMAVTHVPRPHARELVGALRDELKITHATVMTTREAAEGLAPAWERDRQHIAGILADTWTWYQMKKAQPNDLVLPQGHELEHIDTPQGYGEDPSTAFAVLKAGSKREASIGMRPMPGLNRVLFGDFAESSFEGEKAAVSPLFNHLLKMAMQKQHNIAFILGNQRPCLRAELLGRHVLNCEASYRRVDLAPKGNAPR